MIIEIRDVPQGSSIQRIQVDLVPTFSLGDTDPTPATSVAPATSVGVAPVHLYAQSESRTLSPKAERPNVPVPQEMTDLEL